MQTINAAQSEPAVDPIPWTDVVSSFSALGAALFGLATLVVAIVAAVYAKGQLEGLRTSLGTANDQLAVATGQLEEARMLRREQAQPYVVMSAVPYRSMPEFIEVAIQNLGTTGARNVTITCTPPLVRTDQAGGAEEVKIPTTIPFLAPGQEWRTFWDHGRERSDPKYNELPSRHDVSITYTDALDEVHTTPSVLDWSVFTSREWVVEKGVHQGVGQLEKMAKDLHKIAVPQQMTRVAVYDGPQVEKDRTEARAAQWRDHLERTARVLPSSDGQDDDAGTVETDTPSEP